MYVLIKWIKENKVSVGLEKNVKDKKMLSDPKRIGLVEHGAVGVKPPAGKAFPAQVLSVKESLGEIRKAECQWIETHKMWTPAKPKATLATEEDGHSDDEDETPQHQKMEEDPYRTPKRPKTDYRNDMKELEERIKDKEREIRRLRRLNLQLQEGLADTITKTVKDAIQAAQPAPSHPVPSSSSHPAPLLNQIGEIKNESVTDLMNSTALDYAQRCEGYKKLTRTVMGSIFTVATCSVTGKKGIVGEKRQSLDKGKMKLVIDHVKKVHRGIGDTEIKACMAQKLKDTRRRAERETWEPAGGDPED